MRRMWCGVIVIAGLVLSGCANPGELLAEKAAEKAFEHALESGSEDGTKVDIDADGEGGMTIKNEEGSYEFGAHARVPDSFPSGLPLPDGNPVSVAEVEGAIQLSYTEQTLADFDRLADYFENNGYERSASMEMDGLVSKTYVNDSWQVMIGLMGSDAEDSSLTYGVYPQQES